MAEDGDAKLFCSINKSFVSVQGRILEDEISVRAGYTRSAFAPYPEGSQWGVVIALFQNSVEPF